MLPDLVEPSQLLVLHILNNFIQNIYEKKKQISKRHNSFMNSTIVPFNRTTSIAILVLKYQGDHEPVIIISEALVVL